MATTVKGSRNVERLDEVRREVESFETSNHYQAELKTMILAIIDHARPEYCKLSAERVTSERWSAAVAAYQLVPGRAQDGRAQRPHRAAEGPGSEQRPAR